MNITNFIHSIKARADELAILGAPMDHEDLTEEILDALGDDYKKLVRSVQARDTSITFEELYQKLLSFEASIQANMKTDVHFPITTNPTNRTNTTWQPQKFNQNWRLQSQNPTGNAGWRLSPTNPGRPLMATNSGTPPYNNRPPSRPYLGFCQIYGIQRHTAKRCPPFQLVPTQQSNTGSSKPNISAIPWQPQAHYVANNALNNPAWLLDSGASHHVTTDLSNLSLYAPYIGSNDVMIGDGTGLSITHTNSISLPTFTKTFTLNDVLCIPTMKKNLISISQFCIINNASIEFFPYFFM
ncbi:hypothetical protein ACOSP7_024358 [Xanthoceras sorbifolium]